MDPPDTPDIPEGHATDALGPLVFEVEGHSMWPALKPGMVVRVDPQRTPKVGDIVVARHPFRKHHPIVKRVVACDNGFELRGDNWIESEDSSALGRFAREAVIGVVVATDTP